MKRLLLGILAGVTLMYLFDPRHGQNRRQMLAERFRRGKNATSHSDDVIQAGHDTVSEVKERAQTVVGKAQERFGQTVKDATDRAGDTVADVKDQARELNDSTQARAKAAMTSDDRK
jgi:gas vesicle protein